MEPVERALRTAIVADPDDDQPRLVYADWLTERGDAGGAAIVAACRLARMDRRDPAYRAVAAQASAGSAPIGWLPRRSTAARPRRGFYTELRLGTEALPELARYLEQVPVERLVIEVASEAQLRGLRLRRLGRVRELALHAAFPLARAALEPLTTRSYPGIHALVLEATRIDDTAVATVLAGAFPDLRALEIRSGSSVAGRPRTIVDSSAAPRLETLDLHGYTLDALAPLVGLPALTSLRHNFVQNLHAHETLDALFAQLARLELVGMGSNDLAERIAAAARSLRSLVVMYGVGDRGVTAIAHAPGTRALRELRVEERVGLAGAKSLVDSGLLASLYDLGLGYRIDDASARVLATTPLAAGLRSLSLSGGLTDDGACELARSAHLGDLESLYLVHDADIGGIGREALRERFGDRVQLSVPQDERWDPF